MELKFKLGDEVLYQLAVLDEVVVDLGFQKVLENSDFIIDESSSSTFGLNIKVVRLDKNTIPLDFLLEAHAMRIDIDGIPESFEWEIKGVENDETKKLADFIKQLFTSYVLMQYCGSHTVMCLFDSKGQLIYKTTLRYYNYLGSFFNRDCQMRLFSPIYP